MPLARGATRALRLPALAALLLVAGLLALGLVVFGGDVRAGSVPCTPDIACDIDPNLDFALGIGSQCDSNGTPTHTCQIALNATFTVDFWVHSMGALGPGCPSDPACGYAGYDMTLRYSGVTPIQQSLVQRGPGVWPDCVFYASSFEAPGYVSAGCAIARVSGPAPDSRYIGILLHIDFQCPSTDLAGTLTLLPLSNVGPTDLETERDFFRFHVEANPESLHIICGTTPPPVGGISLDPNAGALPSVGAWPLAEILAGVTATVLGLGGAAWYTRRRRLR